MTWIGSLFFLHILTHTYVNWPAPDMTITLYFFKCMFRTFFSITHIRDRTDYLTSQFRKKGGKESKENLSLNFHKTRSQASFLSKYDAH
jgi:hypothetical protein